MIKDNQRHFNRLQTILDAGIVALSYVTAWYIKFESPWMNGIKTISFAGYMELLYLIVPAYMLLYTAFHLYTPRRIQGRRVEMGNLIKANTVGIMIIISILYITRQHDFSRDMFFIFYLINTGAIVVVRLGIKTALRKIRKGGYNQKHILLIGYSRAAEGYIDRITANPQWGYKIRGILDDNIAAGTRYKGVQVLGTIGNLEYILPENKLDEIAITLSIKEYSKLENIVNECEKSGVHTKFIPDYNNIIPTKPYTEDLLGLPVINIRYVPLTNTFNMIIKRMVDVFGAVCGIILASPVMLVTAVAIKLTSKGPLIFKQERIGYHNKPFKMYKFRSMVVQEDTEEEKGWTTKHDPRVTKVGKIIRKTSIDELPQLFNIIRGDMSLVGP